MGRYPGGEDRLLRAWRCFCFAAVEHRPEGKSVTPERSWVPKTRVTWEMGTRKMNFSVCAQPGPDQNSSALKGSVACRGCLLLS